MADLLVIGADEEHEAVLQRLRGADRHRFHRLFSRDDVRGVDEFAVASWLAEAESRIAALGTRPDGIVNYWDFPITEVAAVLGGAHGLPAPSLESLVLVQHKYYARLLQQEVAPEVVPPFEAVDVFDDGSLENISLPFPFWIKPVRSFRSHLGFRITSRSDLARAVTELRAGLPRLAQPYDSLLALAELPVELPPAGGHTCIAEAIISGRQCTLEGWSHDDEVTVYGAVDSIRAPNRTTFARYQYPSSLPVRVIHRMTEVATAFIRRAGLRQSAFNAEFYWDRRHDRIWLLEVNARASQSHFGIFELVDGVANAQVILDIALGQRPALPHREGPWPMAAKCFLRAYHDAVVTHAPGPDHIAAVEDARPGVSIHLDIETGDRLSQLPDQDSYSYELGHVIVGGKDQRDILATFHRVQDRLGLTSDTVRRR